MADIKVKLISGDKVLLIDKRNLDNVSSLSQSSSSSGEISYCSLSNNGSIELTDKKGELLKQLEQTETKNVSVEIYSNSSDGFVNSGKIQKHILKNSSYDIQEKKVTLSLSNDIDFFNTKLKDVYMLNENGERSLAQSTLYNLAVRLFKILNFSDDDIDYMMSKNVIRGENVLFSVAEYFDSIIIDYPYLKSDTARACIDKICSVAQVSFIAEDSGRFVFVDNRPLFDSNTSPIVVKRSNMFSPLKYDPFSKKYVKTIGYSKNESTYDYGSIESINLTLFQQTDDIRTVQLLEGSSVFEGYEHQQVYSGNLSDYEEVVSGSEYKNALSENVSVVGYYPAYYRSVAEQGAQYCIYKIRVDKSKFITEGREFKVGVDVVDGNYLIKNFNPRKSISEFLKNKQLRGYSPVFTVYVAKDEKEALATFGETDSNGDMYAVYPSIFNSAITNRVAVVDSGDEIYVYHGVRKYEKINTFVTDSNIPSNYTGELDDIYLSFDMSLFLKKINMVSNLVNENADYELANNELMQMQTQFGGKDIFSVQTDNIYTDYKDGVLSATLTVGCLDYYHKSGVVAKKWSEGQTLSVGDVIEIDGDLNSDGSQRFWKITGRKFVYDSEPLLHLEMVEAKKTQVSKLAGLYDESSQLIYSWQELISLGYIIIEDDYYGRKTITTANTEVLDGYLYVSEEIQSIGDNSFLASKTGISKLKMIYLPESIELIGKQAFWNNDSLIKIIMPTSVTVVGKWCFVQCYKLEEIDFPKQTLTDEIREGIFDNCQSLKIFKIPEGIKIIKKDAFSSCYKLESLYIPDGVETIESGCFVLCKALKTIYIPESVTSIASKVFNSSNENLIIYCGAPSKPDGWEDSWNSDFTVKWGYSRNQYQNESGNI